jgi:hypothetical protein
MTTFLPSEQVEDDVPGFFMPCDRPAEVFSPVAGVFFRQKWRPCILYGMAAHILRYFFRLSLIITIFHGSVDLANIFQDSHS